MLQPPPDMFYPLLYVHNMYSNMFDKIHRSFTTSWSFYIQGNNGQLIVVQSAQPRLIELASNQVQDNGNNFNVDKGEGDVVPQSSHSKAQLAVYIRKETLSFCYFVLFLCFDRH